LKAGQHEDPYVPSSLVLTEVAGSSSNAILVTGATHARELLSAQAPLFVLLKLLHHGVVREDPQYR